MLVPPRLLPAGGPHPRDPPAADLPRRRGIGHIHDHGDPMGVSLQAGRHIDVTAADEPQPVRPPALRFEEPHLFGIRRVVQPIDRHAGSRRRGAGLLVAHEQQVVGRLQLQAAGPGHGGDLFDHPGGSGIGNVYDAEADRSPEMGDVQVVAPGDELHRHPVAVHIRMPNQPQVETLRRSRFAAVCHADAPFQFHINDSP
jgi:hypothetical protein